MCLSACPRACETQTICEVHVRTISSNTHERHTQHCLSAQHCTAQQCAATVAAMYDTYTLPILCICIFCTHSTMLLLLRYSSSLVSAIAVRFCGGTLRAHALPFSLFRSRALPPSLLLLLAVCVYGGVQLWLFRTVPSVDVDVESNGNQPPDSKSKKQK